MLTLGVKPAYSAPIKIVSGAISSMIVLIVLSMAFQMVGKIPIDLISDTYLTTVEFVLLNAASLH